MTETPTATPTRTPEPVVDSGSDDSGALSFVAVLALSLTGGLAVVLVLVQGAKAVAAERSPSSGRDGGEHTGGGGGWLSGDWSLFGALVRVPQLTMVALVGFSAATANVLASLGRATDAVAAGLGSAVSGSLSLSGALVTGFGGLLSGLGSLSVPSLSGVFGGLRSWGGSESGETPGEDARALSEFDPASGDPADLGPSSVVEAWERFARRVSVPDSESATPGEYARQAVASGAPEDPVWRLTRLFRAVRYGGAAQTDERTSAAVAAMRAIDDGGDGE